MAYMRIKGSDFGYNIDGDRLPPKGEELLISADGDTYVAREGADLEFTIDGDLEEIRSDGSKRPARRWRP